MNFEHTCTPPPMWIAGGAAHSVSVADQRSDAIWDYGLVMGTGLALAGLALYSSKFLISYIRGNHAGRSGHRGGSSD